MTLLLLGPGRLHENRYGTYGFGVWQPEEKLSGKKSDAVASGFGI